MTDRAALDPGAVAAARRAFAEELRATAHLRDDALVAAFARVPREAFLGAGPWQIAQPFDREHPYRTTPDDDPRHLWHDVVVAIDPARGLNNGQPSALARWIEAAAPRPGDAVLHVGCGTGYYSAILAELVGPAGRVDAIDVDPALAARAAANLAPWPQARAAAGDASAPPAGAYDVVLINAGATHPRPAWLAALREGGRIVVPLTAHVPAIPFGVGLMVRAERRGERWPVAALTPVAIYDCDGARDPDAEAQLRPLLAPGAFARVAALSIAPHPRGDACLLHVDGACLQA